MSDELLKTIKDTKRDYIGMNGMLYQDLSRYELDIISREIEGLRARIDKAIEYIEEFNELVGYNNEGDSYSNTEKKLLDILKGSDSNEIN